MDKLFDDGKGEIFSESLKWLESKEENLQLSGALAVGNFARSGKKEHCCPMVECLTTDPKVVGLNPGCVKIGLNDPHNGHKYWLYTQETIIKSDLAKL